MPGNSLDSLHSKILGWLKEQGYSLEMRVAQAFRQVGFEVSQAQRYQDPGSDELREIDVVATVHRQVDRVGVSVSLFIECKYSQDKPWVIFTSPRRLDSLAYFSRILREKYDVYKWKTQRSLQGRLLARILCTLPRDEVDFDFFRIPQNVGYGAVQVSFPKPADQKPADQKPAGQKSSGQKPAGQDRAYTALMQVSSCIEAHDIEVETSFEGAVQEYNRIADSGSTKLGFTQSQFSFFCSFGFPIVILQGSLFESHLDARNEIAISEIDERVVVLGSKNRVEESSSKPCTSVVRIVTEDRLMSLASKAYCAANLLLSNGEAIQEVWEYEYQKLEKAEPKGPPF